MANYFTAYVLSHVATFWITFTFARRYIELGFFIDIEGAVHALPGGFRLYIGMVPAKQQHELNTHYIFILKACAVTLNTIPPRHGNEDIRWHAHLRQDWRSSADVANYLSITRVVPESCRCLPRVPSVAAATRLRISIVFVG
jgi:hypothetical protein